MLGHENTPEVAPAPPEDIQDRLLTLIAEGEGTGAQGRRGERTEVLAGVRLVLSYDAPDRLAGAHLANTICVNARKPVGDQRDAAERLCACFHRWRTGRGEVVTVLEA